MIRKYFLSCQSFIACEDDIFIAQLKYDYCNIHMCIHYMPVQAGCQEIFCLLCKQEKSMMRYIGQKHINIKKLYSEEIKTPEQTKAQ